MIYTPLVKKAMLIAYEAHNGQFDKSGYPYIHHPMHLAEQMHTEYETITALLHDVVEDTPVTLQELRNEGFPETVMQALQLLSHEDGVPYFDYIRNMRENETALKVKRADLMHNMDETRLPESKRSPERMSKYAEALKMVEGFLVEFEKK
ncbi:MAG TPA: GTP pyrophosphokinase [Ruminococcus sp.]|nr:GTP pyrophosphokinase [Ruminococcus sp.]